MKRKSFFAALSASVLPLTTSFDSIRSKNLFERMKKGLHTPSGKDRNDKPISLFEGDTFFTKVSSKDSDGDTFVFESTRVKEGGPSYHLHYDQDEFWYVVSGEFQFKIGEETFLAKAGDTVFGPRQVPHTFSKVGEGEARLLMFFQPAGKMEEMFRKISEGVTKNMNEGEQNDFRHQHGIKKVGPALTHFKKW